jgi:hypothetical protein
MSQRGVERWGGGLCSIRQARTVCDTRCACARRVLWLWDFVSAGYE